VKYRVSALKLPRAISIYNACIKPDDNDHSSTLYVGIRSIFVRQHSVRGVRELQFVVPDHGPIVIAGTTAPCQEHRVSFHRGFKCDACE